MPKKSDAMHKLAGTKSQPNPEAPQAFEPGRPKYPKGISAEAKVVFKRLCSLLEKRRALTEADGELLRLYSITFDRHAKATTKLADEGEIRTYTRLDSNGQPHEVEKENLWLKVAFSAEKNLVAIIDRLGLSPLNRAKVKPTGKPPEAPTDPFEDFMNKGSARQPSWGMPAHFEIPEDFDETTAN